MRCRLAQRLDFAASRNTFPSGRERAEGTTGSADKRPEFLDLRRLHFGAKSERLAGQAELFDERHALPVPPVEVERIGYERERLGRPRLPKNLPRSRIDSDLEEAEKATFDSVRGIGEELSETLDYTPARLS